MKGKNSLSAAASQSQANELTEAAHLEISLSPVTVELERVVTVVSMELPPSRSSSPAVTGSSGA
jgi:hypothetical protein